MKKLTIPDDDAALLREWLLPEGGDASIEAVLRALEAAEPALSWRVLASRVATETNLASDVIEHLLMVFLNAINTIAHFDDQDRKEAPTIIFHSVVGDVADSTQRGRFVQRFERVLQAKSIEVTGKALGVQQEDQRGFCTARIVSQLRPIFSDDPLEPRAAVILHQLKLVYHIGPEDARGDIFVSMTMADLSFLREVIDRAIAKHMKLVVVAEKAGIPAL